MCLFVYWLLFEVKLFQEVIVFLTKYAFYVIKN